MNIVYVDDERPAIDNFRLTVAHFTEVSQLSCFQNGEDALAYIKNNVVDVVFLDMEMPGIHGLGLAKEIKNYNSNIRIVFVTAYSQYALDAWGVDASGYLLKPYTAADIRKELYKCTYKPLPSHRVTIETIPDFSISVDGSPLYIAGSKPREMLALLVDCKEHGFTMGECISYLWPEREADTGTQSLYRMTWKRMMDALDNVGVSDIILTSDNRRYIKTDEIDCDLYRILSGDRQEAKKYCGRYLQEYPWAEERNSQLYWMLKGKEIESE